jgi:Spy/CpxP family protein refolding chaperone
MKKVLLLALLFSASLFYVNEAVAATSNDNIVMEEVGPNPGQRIIDHINQWTVLTQDQINQIIDIANDYDWASATNKQEYRALFKPFRQQVQALLTPAQIQEIMDNKEG